MSIVYSLGAALLAALVSIVCVRFVQKSKNKLNKLFEYGALIPWLLPSTLIALGLTMAYGDRNPLIFNKVLVGTTVILLIGYVVIKLPFSYRMIRSAFFSVDEDLEDAAKCMGASTFYTMRKVIIPVILPAVLSVVILNFNGLLADYDLTAFLYHPLFQPLGIVVKAASDENASIDAKCMSFVYTVVLMILSSVALYFGQGNGMQAIRRWRQKRIEKKVLQKIKTCRRGRGIGRGTAPALYPEKSGIWEERNVWSGQNICRIWRKGSTRFPSRCGSPFRCSAGEFWGWRGAGPISQRGCAPTSWCAWEPRW